MSTPRSNEIILAYFTDPMGDEFKKAMEEAMKEMEEEEKRSAKRSKKTRSKPKKEITMKRLSKKTRNSLR